MKDFDRSRLTTYEDMAKTANTAIVETKSGKIIEIQAVQPGDILKAAGSPLMQLLTADGIDLSDAATAEDSIKNIDLTKQAELVSNPEFIEMAQEIVITGVISINFVDKRQEDCDTERKEVTIDKLNLKEIIELFTVIMTISVSDDDLQDFYTFREESEVIQTEYGENTSDSKDVRPETESVAVPVEEVVESQSTTSPG